MRPKTKTIKKDLLDDYKKHSGKCSLDAMLQYVELVRSLLTLGAHFFVVWVRIRKYSSQHCLQRDKSRMSPLILGIAVDAILVLEFKSKEVIEKIQLGHIKSFIISENNLKIKTDEKCFVFHTKEGKKINDMIQDAKSKSWKKEQRVRMINKILDSIRNNVRNDVERSKEILSQADTERAR